jgi:hypothetical protein
MSDPIVKEHNTDTAEIVERPMTANELDAFNAMAAIENEIQQKKSDLETAKTAAEAKLTALGLTKDDLKALGL